MAENRKGAVGQSVLPGIAAFATDDGVPLLGTQVEDAGEPDRVVACGLGNEQ